MTSKLGFIQTTHTSVTLINKFNSSCRCSLLGKDLNRQYQNPNEDAFPELFHMKSVVRSLSKLCKEVFVCDLHGHNRRTGAFLYGCDSGYQRRDPRAPHPRMFSTSPEQYLLDRLLPYLISKQVGVGFGDNFLRFPLPSFLLLSQLRITLVTSFVKTNVEGILTNQRGHT
ncbi:unnamed protein product [Dibothriocephalus latus]|uniref:Peptidase M14 domain-containing protein n=1 Tax=Dibothriocephalus latus TaxID=60516 RepID=A0A3P6Q514_DIBLA|nr:unnamed protein product [Dibothriocephalus latus]